MKDQSNAERCHLMESAYFERHLPPEERAIREDNQAADVLNCNASGKKDVFETIGEPIPTISLGGVSHQLVLEDGSFYLVSPAGERYDMGSKTTREAFRGSLKDLRRKFSSSD